MSTPMVKTKTPGIYKRGIPVRLRLPRRREAAVGVGAHAGRCAPAEAKPLDGRRSRRARGALPDHAARVRREWIGRYQGTGRRGFREETRDEYRGLLDRYALRYFPDACKLTEVTPKKVAGFIGWLCDPTERARQLADKTVRNALSPLRAALATARREGLIRHNPVPDVALPHRARIEEDDEIARARSRRRDGARRRRSCTPTTG